MNTNLYDLCYNIACDEKNVDLKLKNAWFCS